MILLSAFNAEAKKSNSTDRTTSKSEAKKAKMRDMSSKLKEMRKKAIEQDEFDVLYNFPEYARYWNDIGFSFSKDGYSRALFNYSLFAFAKRTGFHLKYKTSLTEIDASTYPMIYRDSNGVERDLSFAKPLNGDRTESLEIGFRKTVSMKQDISKAELAKPLFIFPRFFPSPENSANYENIHSMIVANLRGGLIRRRQVYHPRNGNSGFVSMNEPKTLVISSEKNIVASRDTTHGGYAAKEIFVFVGYEIIKRYGTRVQVHRKWENRSFIAERFLLGGGYLDLMFRMHEELEPVVYEGQRYFPRLGEKPGEIDYSWPIGLRLGGFGHWGVGAYLPIRGEVWFFPSLEKFGMTIEIGLGWAE